MSRANIPNAYGRRIYIPIVVTNVFYILIWCQNIVIFNKIGLKFWETLGEFLKWGTYMSTDQVVTNHYKVSNHYSLRLVNAECNAWERNFYYLHLSNIKNGHHHLLLAWTEICGPRGLLSLQFFLKVYFYVRRLPLQNIIF